MGGSSGDLGLEGGVVSGRVWVCDGSFYDVYDM